MVGTITFRIHMKKEVYKRFPSFFFLWGEFSFPFFFSVFYPLRNETKSTYLVEKKHHGMVNLSYVGTWPFLLSFIIILHPIQHASGQRKLMQFSLTT